MATRKSNEVTLALIAAAKRGDRAYGGGMRYFAHFTRDTTQPSYSREIGTARITIATDSLSDVRTMIDVPMRIAFGHTDAVETHTHDGRSWEAYSETYEPQNGFVSFSSQTFIDAVLSCPSHAELSLEVYLDALTNQTLVDARLHGDATYLIAKWTEGKREVTRRFLVETSVGPHNTARFGNSKL